MTSVYPQIPIMFVHNDINNQMQARKCEVNESASKILKSSSKLGTYTSNPNILFCPL